MMKTMMDEEFLTKIVMKTLALSVLDRRDDKRIFSLSDLDLNDALPETLPEKHYRFSSPETEFIVIVYTMSSLLSTLLL